MEVLDFINKNKNLKYEDIKNILETKYNLHIRLDKSNDYYMISTTTKSDLNNIFIRQCTGIIINKACNKILHYFGEKAYDINNTNDNNTIEIKNINIKKCLIAPYIDGHIIKVFNYKKEWRFATSKHTNIKLYRLNNENITLYEMFKNCILKTFDTMIDFLNSLDVSYCYSFILKDNNLYLINKMYIHKLEEYYNFNNFRFLFNINNTLNEVFDKYLIIEKDNKKIKRKIHASINDINEII